MFVHSINQMLASRLPGEKVEYLSFDSVEEDPQNLYQIEFLNSLNLAGFPQHQIVLKPGCPIILLRNMDKSLGLCNGTRLICERLGRNLIHARIAIGDQKGKKVTIPRIPLISDPEETKLPFKLIRKQFPIHLAFGLTINKSQGQTIGRVGIHLQEPVFSHGQLYVALSRSRSSTSTKIMVTHSQNTPALPQTRNVVYKEVFQST